MCRGNPVFLYFFENDYGRTERSRAGDVGTGRPTGGKRIETGESEVLRVQEV